MIDETLKALWNKGIEMMAQGYTWAETTLRVLRETAGWDEIPYQWVVAGYMGAIDSGKTIFGILFGAPALKDDGRARAIASVKGLFQGFIERLDTTDCCTLTGWDFSQKTDIRRYFKEKIYEHTCYGQFVYVFRQCLAQLDA